MWVSIKYNEVEVYECGRRNVTPDGEVAVDCFQYLGSFL